MTVSRKACLWVVTLGSIVALSAGALVYAFNPQPDPPGHYFGAMGLVVGQGLSLNVGNRKVPAVQLPTDQTPPDPCRADMRIVNDRGQLVARHSAMVGPGESVALNFTNPPEPDRGTADLAGEADPPGGRQLFRAFVLYRGASAHCMTSLEVTDATGKSNGFMNPGDLVGFNPQPDPPGIGTRR
ncbi:MAG: hypothetical protein ABI665_00685 [Vicinamibacterales bacterium]